ncbi:MAG: hypothetical protein FJY54_17230 [Betaproteobacteria bacterium]|nr:hypothetical protein [Betaproteobacteria bacterium]
MRRAIWILWPSFIVAGIAETAFFTLFDPMELTVLGQPAGLSRIAVYSLGFFVFWGFAAASSAFTCFLQRGSADINRLCPLEAPDRPVGCPRREERPDSAGGP